MKQASWHQQEKDAALFLAQNFTRAYFSYVVQQLRVYFQMKVECTFEFLSNISEFTCIVNQTPKIVDGFFYNALVIIVFLKVLSKNFRGPWCEVLHFTNFLSRIIVIHSMTKTCAIT